MPKKYTGPERRGQEQTRREVRKLSFPFGESIITGDRRWVRDYEQGRGARPTLPNSPTRNADEGHSRHDIVEFKEHRPSIERRYLGAGRRSGDLARALETGESAIFQIGKGAMKSVGKLGKLARKAGKHIPVIGTAIGLYDLVNRNKQ
jgi:hypothetical protein